MGAIEVVLDEYRAVLDAGVGLKNEYRIVHDARIELASLREREKRLREAGKALVLALPDNLIDWTRPEIGNTNANLIVTKRDELAALLTTSDKSAGDDVAAAEKQEIADYREALTSVLKTWGALRAGPSSLILEVEAANALKTARTLLAKYITNWTEG